MTSMQHTWWKTWLAWVVLSFAAVGTAWALPSEADVQAQVKAGQYEQAEQAMAQVVAAKPDSAKAHYVYAQILAHQRKFVEAAQQAQRAKALDPAVKFTQPEKFRSFEALLERELHGATTHGSAATSSSLSAPAMNGPTAGPANAAVPERAAGGVPGWVWGAGFAVLAVLGWKALSRGFRAPVTSPAMPMQTSVQPQAAGVGGYGMAAPGYGYGNAVPPTGNGLRTGLAAGAGLAGGLAAGMLLDEMLHRGDHGATAGPAPAVGDSGLLGGVEPGFFDREVRQDAADQLTSRDIDFGSGDSWDDGGSAGGSSDDW